jgi:ligand-binding SRPBCC domain-containing protein
MKIFTLSRKQTIPVSIEKAWSFFSSPYNLEKITPGYMNFKVKTDIKNQEVYEGMKIEYRVSPLLGIPLKWVTVITDVEAPFKFKDIQEDGPFSLWEHTHIFKEVPEGVEMIDEIRYAIPLGIIGELAHSLVVKRQVEGIFKYRFSVLDKIF